MQAKYDKVIVHEDENGVPKVVVIFDEKLHLPVFYGTDRYGMDEVIELLGGNKNVLQNNEPTNIQDIQ